MIQTSRDPEENTGQVPQERAAVVAWYLAHGEALTTRQVTELTGTTMRGALAMMYRLSRVLPVYQNDIGQWEVCATQEAAY